MTRQTASVDIALVADLAAAVRVPLVLHGSSGVRVAQLREATAAGMRKINVGTALNVAFTDSIRSQLAADPLVVDPRRYLAGAREAVADVVEQLLRDLSAS
jgi:fructose-bisphosphate aldolase class II